MKLDFRLLIPIAAPFVFIAIIRAAAYCAGAEWTQGAAEFTAIMSVAAGLGGGIFWAACMIVDGIEIGSIQLWERD